MLSQSQFGNSTATANRSAMPESVKFDGPAPDRALKAQPRTANSIPKPGFSS